MLIRIGKASVYKITKYRYLKIQMLRKSNCGILQTKNLKKNATPRKILKKIEEKVD